MTRNMKIGTPILIEGEYESKMAYDNLLADLRPFIYTQFLSSKQKYFDEDYIKPIENPKYKYNEIQSL